MCLYRSSFSLSVSAEPSDILSLSTIRIYCISTLSSLHVCKRSQHIEHTVFIETARSKGTSAVSHAKVFTVFLSEIVGIQIYMTLYLYVHHNKITTDIP